MLACFGDESVQEAIMLGFRNQGVDVGWIEERGLKGLPDPDVAALALSERRVLLTTDTDFLALSSHAALNGVAFPPVLFWPQQQRSIGTVINRVKQLVDRDDYDAIIGQLLFA